MQEHEPQPDRIERDSARMDARRAADAALRVLIVDPHPAFRNASKALLQTEGLDVVGDLGDYDGAFETAAELRPDIALLDVSPYEPDGLDLAVRLRNLPDPPAVVLMSAASPDAILVSRFDAQAFVPKARVTGKILAHAAALREIPDGRSIVEPDRRGR
jgi:DNA-binding NarL/FixJ family response regulator